MCVTNIIACTELRVDDDFEMIAVNMKRRRSPVTCPVCPRVFHEV